MKPFGVGTHSDPFNSVKFDGNVSGGGNLNQQDVNAGFSFKLERLKFRFGGQFLQQPAFNFLIFVFGSAEMGRGADNGVSGIVDAVDDLGAFFFQQSGGVGKGGDMFAESLPVRIDFELDPLGFSAESDQGVEVKLKLPKRRFVQHLPLSLRMTCTIVA